MFRSSQIILFYTDIQLLWHLYQNIHIYRILQQVIEFGIRQGTMPPPPLFLQKRFKLIKTRQISFGIVFYALFRENRSFSTKS